MSDLALFDMEPVALPPNPPGLSADRRRTLRQRRQAAAGIHPLTRQPVHPDGTRSCGNCTFRQLFEHHNRTYPKCTANEGIWITSGAASDVRAWWPACRQHEWGDAKIGPDAARWVPGGAS